MDVFFWNTVYTVVSGKTLVKVFWNKRTRRPLGNFCSSDDRTQRSRAVAISRDGSRCWYFCIRLPISLYSLHEYIHLCGLLNRFVYVNSESGQRVAVITNARMDEQLMTWRWQVYNSVRSCHTLLLEQLWSSADVVVQNRPAFLLLIPFILPAISYIVRLE